MNRLRAGSDGGDRVGRDTLGRARRRRMITITIQRCLQEETYICPALPFITGFLATCFGRL
jgi:hypothetical protein